MPLPLEATTPSTTSLKLFTVSLAISPPKGVETWSSRTLPTSASPCTECCTYLVCWSLSFQSAMPWRMAFVSSSTRAYAPLRIPNLVSASSANSSRISVTAQMPKLFGIHMAHVATTAAQLGDDTSLWHQRLRHIRITSLRNISDHLDDSPPSLQNVANSSPATICTPCMQGKQTKLPRPSATSISSI